MMSTRGVEVLLYLPTVIMDTDSRVNVPNLLFPHYENLYSPHNSDSSSDKIDTKLYNKDTKNKLN